MGPYTSMGSYHSGSDTLKAIEVRSGPFDYGSGTLKVNSIGRYDSRELMGLLTYVDPGPLLTKKGTPRVHQPPKHKDQTAAFYEAQLIHYGLPPRKTKPAAKKVLLEAAECNGGEFVVPDDIVQLEGRMAEEYRVKKEEQTEEQAEIKARRKKAEGEASRKRKRDQDALMKAAFGPTSSRKKAKSSHPPTRVKLASLSGEYTVAAPELNMQWGYLHPDPFTVRFGLSSSGSHMWGDFDFGIVEGSLRSQMLNAGSFNGTVSFHWRGCETGEGESTYGPENVAELTFLGNGMFRGTMSWGCTGTFELAGKLDADMSRNKGFRDEVVRTCKSEYRQLNQSNYEVESVSRWGRWGGVARPDRPEGSDTTNAGYGSDEGDEDDEESHYDEESQEGEDNGDDEDDHEDAY